MINSIEIENFRCFKNVELDDLKTINLIVGKNGSGKTAFLEALYFTLGGPALAFKLRTWRGLGASLQFTEYVESRNALWRDLFYKFDQNRSVKIRFKGSTNLARMVRITAGADQESQLVSGKKGQPVISRIPPISFSYFQGGGHLVTVRPTFGPDGIQFENSPPPLHGSFYPSALPIDPLETASHFSSLSKQGKEKPVIAALQKLFPMIEDLTLEMSNAIPIIHASIEGISEKVPSGLLSTGITKVIAYLVSIANQPHGIVIADEIENGLYFNSMRGVWDVLHDFCKEHDVQFFASTHSDECLEAAGEAATGKEDDFSLLRAERNKDESIIRQFTGMSFKNAMVQDAEVR